MRAVLVATGHPEGLGPLLHTRPSPLLNVGNKAIIEHIIEFLTQHGIKQFDLLLNHLPKMIEDRLGDGKRWGVQIIYHLVKNADYPFSVLQPLAMGWGDEIVLLGVGDCLPRFVFENKSPGLMCFPSRVWSGWGVIPAKTLSSINQDIAYERLAEQLKGAFIEVDPYLSTRTLKELRDANQKLIMQNDSPLLFPSTAKKVEEGVWISRSVSLHPSVNITPPVFIGENCQIKKGVQLGPNAIIENNCIIDTQSIVENSLVCQRSYVGEKLEVRNSIIDRNLLINLSLDSHVMIKDDFILGEVASLPFNHYPLIILESLFASLLLVILFPIFLIMLCTSRLCREKMLLLPASDNITEWETFDLLTFQSKNPRPFQSFFKRLPILINIIRGEIHFVGVAPRSVKETNAMQPDWKKLFLKSKIGIITLSDLNPETSTSMDDRYADEVYYATHMGFRFDVKLILRWLRKKFRL